MKIMFARQFEIMERQNALLEKLIESQSTALKEIREDTKVIRDDAKAMKSNALKGFTFILRLSQTG